MAACQSCRNTPPLPHLASTLTFLFLIIPLATSLTFKYPQFLHKDDTLNFEGDVYQENGVIQLTRYEKDSFGRVKYYKNMHLWDRESGKLRDFTTNFSFIINSQNKGHDADGITFFLACPNFPLPVPRDGSGIGLVSRHQMHNPNYSNKYPFVAVEFDTFGNDWDPKYDHVGINIKSMSTPYTTEWFRIKDGRRYHAEISYNSSSTNLSVTFTGFKNNVTVKQQISYVIDLRHVLPPWVEVGFSSATGSNSWYENNTLCSWSFYSSLEAHNGTELQNDESKSRLLMGLSIGVGTLIGVLGLTWLVIWKLGRRGIDCLDCDPTMDNDFERGTGPKKFSYNELVRATNNFAEERKLGEGGFGRVYKGFTRELNNYAAVKKVLPGSRQGMKEYAAEVKIISQLRHRNLVQLIGWCHKKNDLLLIYEFMSNGSLDSHLFNGRSLLTWEARYNIARGLASAMLYLHEEWEQCVLHRDIKSSNFMLDSNFNAKLGDFGLARLVDHGKGSQTTVLAGTVGYMDPESVRKGKASRESDVYSFGVVALEIACGRKPIEPNANEEQVCLVEWVRELYGTDDLLEAADPRLCGDFDEQEIERLMIVGLWCSHPNYFLRPTIRQAVHVLNFEAPLPTLPSEMLMPSQPISSSSLHSGAAAYGNNQTQPSNSSSYTTGSSQSITSSAFLSPSTALLHTN